jgi:hypothetical protein
MMLSAIIWIRLEKGIVVSKSVPYSTTIPSLGSKSREGTDQEDQGCLLLSYELPFSLHTGNPEVNIRQYPIGYK